MSLLLFMVAQDAPVDPISGGAGWVGAGLLGAVLAWLMFIHLPAKDKFLKEIIKEHAESVNSVADKHALAVKIAAEKHEAAVRQLTESFQLSMDKVVSHCREEMDRIIGHWARRP